MKNIRIAYLANRYPMISMTFILREVRTLRRIGFDILTASINLPDHGHNQLTAVEQEEVAMTYYVKKDGVTGALKAHLYTLLTQPLSYLRGLFFALRLGQWDLKKILYGFFYFVEAVMIGQWMRREQCSHLHVHLGTAGATVGLIAKRTFPITFSFTTHGPQDFYDTSGYYLTKKVIEASFVCCISHFTRSQLMMLSHPSHWDKLEVSRLGIDPAIFTPRPFREKPDPIEILCIGRLVPEKGQSILIKAVAHLIDKGHKLRLRLVGDGSERERLEEQVKQLGVTEQVILEGSVNQDRIRTFYNQADIFVLASFAEGLPVVLMEAMSMEIPCVTTNITGIPELITSGNDGILVAASDVNGLANAIALLMDKPNLRHKIGKEGRQRVLEHYELQKNTERLANIFRRRLTIYH